MSYYVTYIASEFSVISARFYRDCPLKEFRGECWNSKYKAIPSYNQEYSYCLNLINAFIIIRINAYNEPQKQALVITLFLLIAKECLHTIYGPDLATTIVITLAHFTSQIRKLQFAFSLLEKPILEIYYSLQQLTEHNFQHYRGLLASDVRSLPSLMQLYSDKIHIFECTDLYNQTTEFGKIFYSLLAIKKQLKNFFLESKSDLIAELEKIELTPEGDFIDPEHGVKLLAKGHRKLSLTLLENKDPLAPNFPISLEPKKEGLSTSQILLKNPKRTKAQKESLRLSKHKKTLVKSKESLLLEPSSKPKPVPTKSSKTSLKKRPSILPLTSVLPSIKIIPPSPHSANEMGEEIFLMAIPPEIKGKKEEDFRDRRHLRLSESSYVFFKGKNASLDSSEDLKKDNLLPPEPNFF